MKKKVIDDVLGEGFHRITTNLENKLIRKLDREKKEIAKLTPKEIDALLAQKRKVNSNKLRKPSIPDEDYFSPEKKLDPNKLPKYYKDQMVPGDRVVHSSSHQSTVPEKAPKMPNVILRNPPGPGVEKSLPQNHPTTPERKKAEPLERIMPAINPQQSESKKGEGILNQPIPQKSTQDLAGGHTNQHKAQIVEPPTEQQIGGQIPEQQIREQQVKAYQQQQSSSQKTGANITTEPTESNTKQSSLILGGNSNNIPPQESNPKQSLKTGGNIEPTTIKVIAESNTRTIPLLEIKNENDPVVKEQIKKSFSPKPFSENKDSIKKSFSSESLPSFPEKSLPSFPSSEEGGSPKRKMLKDSNNSALYDPDRNSFDLLKLLQAGTIDIDDITIDERVMVVRSMKLMGRTVDEIAAMLRAKRSLVSGDFYKIRQHDRQELMSYELEELGGEIWSLSMEASRQAMKAGKFSSVSKILESMVNMLQSMGLVYKAPAQSQLAAMVSVTQHQVGQRNFTKYQDAINGEREEVIGIMSQLLEGINDDKLG